jgi:predicted esterase YcpF (UPF0227 family)
MVTHLLYLHGLRSSPQSGKAHRVGAWVAEHTPRVKWWCPQLPASPRQALAMLLEGTADWPKDRMGIVGSSLGGFYAMALAERYRCPAVLLNPAVDPARDLAGAVGESTAWNSDEPFVFLPEYLDELRAMAPPGLARPQNYLAIIATGDEVLAWREMAQFCQGAHLRIVEGSDHQLTDFDQHLPHLLHFLRLGPNP